MVKGVREIKTAIFCHSDSYAADDLARQELQRQCCVLENYAIDRQWTVEHCFLHTGKLNFKDPDEVLLRLFRYAQTKAFALILVERMALFPVSQPILIPYVRLYFINEHICLPAGVNTGAVFQTEFTPPRNLFVYWRHG